ncbi:hypothetical protein U1Q18_033555 [Sarracenia purpurea var. burkii]
MAGRNYQSSNALKLRDKPLGRAPLTGRHALIEDPRILHRDPVPPPSGASRPHPSLVEERIAAHHREVQSLLLDNQRLAATHIALKQELAAAQQELRHLSAAAADIKAERDAQVREVYERSLTMEAEVRSIDALNAELAEVRADAQKLTAARQDLTAKLKQIDGDVLRIRSELQILPAIKSEIETMHQEIQRGRAAIECEKKAHAGNLEQGQAMEKNMISMAREIEKLHAELVDAEKRARAAAAATASPGYAVYRNSSYPDPYATHQVQGIAGPGPQYGSAMAPPGPYNTQINYVHR